MQRYGKKTYLPTYSFWWTFFYEQAAVEYRNSRKLTAPLAPLIKNQIKQYTVDKTQIKITKQVMKNKRRIDATPA